MKKTIALLLAAVMLLSLLAACSKTEAPAEEPAQEEQTTEAPAQEETPAEEPEQPAEEQPSQEELDQEAADNVAALIDAIYVQERTDDTDAQCEAAKAAWEDVYKRQGEHRGQSGEQRRTECIEDPHGSPLLFYHALRCLPPERLLF